MLGYLLILVGTIIAISNIYYLFTASSRWYAKLIQLGIIVGMFYLVKKGYSMEYPPSTIQQLMMTGGRRRWY